jgi:hypothetical protein
MEKLERLRRSGREGSRRSGGREAEGQGKAMSKDFNAEALRALRNAREELKSRTPHARSACGAPDWNLIPITGG